MENKKSDVEKLAQMNPVEVQMIAKSSPKLSSVITSKHYLELLSEYYIIPVPKDIKEAMMYMDMDYNKRLVIASKKGDIKTVRRLISLDTDAYNEAMIGSVESGNIHIVKLMITLGADDYDGVIECTTDIDIVTLIEGLRNIH